MKFEKDIVSFDLETTGLDKSKDFIIQLAAIKFNIDDNNNIVVKDKINYYVKPVGNYTITIQAYLKHGIKPEMLADKPTLSDIADDILKFVGDCDLLTFNGVSFDIPFLEFNLNKIGKSLDIFNRKCYDAFREEKRRNGNNLESCYSRYIGKTMEEDNLTAHNAYSDVAATIKIFKAQQDISSYGSEDLITDDGFVENKMFQGIMQPVFSNGKYRDVSVSLVKRIDPGYISWILSSSGVSDITKNIIRNN